MPVYFNGTANNLVGQFIQIFLGNSHLCEQSMFLSSYVAQNLFSEKVQNKKHRRHPMLVRRCFLNRIRDFFYQLNRRINNLFIFDKQKSRSARQPPAWSSLTVHMRKLLLFPPPAGFLLVFWSGKIIWIHFLLSIGFTQP